MVRFGVTVPYQMTPAPNTGSTSGPSDLTGHTAHLLIVTSAGTTVDTIAGTVTPAATSSIEFAITSAAVATAGTYSYAVIFDMATASLKRTVQTGDWIVTDYPG